MRIGINLKMANNNVHFQYIIIFILKRQECNQNSKICAVYGKDVVNEQMACQVTRQKF